MVEVDPPVHAVVQRPLELRFPAQAAEKAREEHRLVCTFPSGTLIVACAGMSCRCRRQGASAP